MFRFHRSGRPLRCAVWAAVCLTTTLLTAADGNRAKPLPEGEVVDIFAAIEKRQIEVQLIPRDSSKCRLLIENKTDKPLNVQLPPAFAGVPVLAQQFPNQFPVNNRRNNGPQQLGVVPGIPPMGPGIFNVDFNRAFPNQGGPNVLQFPGRMFNVAPEKVGKFKLASLCLEYGKPEPRPKFKYQIKPIDSVTAKPGVAELCATFGQGKISRRVAQLAAWHLNNDMTWQQLSDLRHKVANGTRPSYTQAELKAAEQAAEEAVELAKQRQDPAAGKEGSLSRS